MEETGTVEPKTYKFDKEDSIRSNKFSKDGYKFKEWNTCADGSGQSYSEKQIIKNLTETDNSVITLYAQWNSNGGGGGGWGHEGGGSHESDKHSKTSSATNNHNEKSDSLPHSEKTKEASYSINSDEHKDTNTIMSSIIKFAFGILTGSFITTCVFILIKYIRKKKIK